MASVFSQGYLVQEGSTSLDPEAQVPTKCLLLDDVFGLPDVEASAPRWSKSANPTALMTPSSRDRNPMLGGFGDAEECRLLDCGTVSPTCATVPDDPRLEFDDFRIRSASLSREFHQSKDVQGMVSSIVALDSQCFHDELVAVLLRSSLDRKEAERESAVALLRVLLDEKHVSTTQLVRGYEKLVLMWEDLRLDVPDGPGHLVGLLSSKAGLFDRDLFKRLPDGLLGCVCDRVPPGASHDTLEQYVRELQAFKKDVAGRLKDVLSGAASIKSFATWLQGVDAAAFHHEVVLGACLSAVGAPSERFAEKQKAVFEMFKFLTGANNGFCGVNGELDCSPLLTESDLQLGFSRLLGMVGELVKADATVSTTVVSLFRGAVEQELLAADFLKTARRLRFGGLPGVQVLREAQRQTPAFSRRVWGSGDKRHLQAETREAILEYFDSGSVDELGQIVGELHLSDKELIKFLRKMLVSGMESKQSDKALDAMSELKGFFWSDADVQEAFDELQGVADDLVLDLPYCREQINALMQRAHGRGLLEESYLGTACISAV